MTSSLWGDDETKFFFELTPERILDAVEASTGWRCTGRVMALNSMENRVYDVEIDRDHDNHNDHGPNGTPKAVIAKFYRPGRWSEAQILDEHRFLLELQEHEVPVIAPLTLRDGQTLHRLISSDQNTAINPEPGTHLVAEPGLKYAIFPKIQGRSPDELDNDHLAQIGRLLARIHNVGAARSAHHRLVLCPATYGLNNLEFLLSKKIIPADYEQEYRDLVRRICEKTSPWFADAPRIRLHGDCHLGNLMVGRLGTDVVSTRSLFFVDFDDMVIGPPVQDIWLLVPGRDHEAQMQRQVLLEAYDTMRPFDALSLRLIEPLRALRFVHFSAWIARRWQDPAFPRSFAHFGTTQYWLEQLADLREQWLLIQGEIPGGHANSLHAKNP